MSIGLQLALFGVALNAAAQLFLKAGTERIGAVNADWGSLQKVLTTVPFYGGFACYAVSLVVWIMALSRLPVSVAYPLVSVGYIANAVLAWWLFDEALSPQKLIGIGFIVVGVVILARAPQA